jgi:indolepyruvate ferredoxin oxidoreductase beta subunit
MKTKNILIVGVGGQGTILASKILSSGLVDSGYDVKMAEIHGMSQRGGSVSTQIKFGEKVYAPTIGIGEADIILGFELMESLRWLKYLKPNGKIIVNDYKIPSAPILSGQADYPTTIKDHLTKVNDCTFIKAYDTAKALGNAKVMNVVMLGHLIRAFDLETIDWNKIIETEVKEQFVDINKKALNLD